MEPNQEQESMNVVELASSDDGEDGNDVSRRKSRSSEAHIRPESVPVPSPTGRTQGSESRSFWKAGAYDVGPVKFGSTQGVLEQARVHPKFLHSNATSHKWAFGAIAELLDNAVDEIPGGATFVKVDKLYNKENAPALLFQDDGGGMSPESIRHCMSLGYSKKKSNTTIGQYGNGFKTSTMRLGADVIVFSRTTLESRTTQSIGLLSYTFLRKTGQDDVIVPMVDFKLLDYQHAEPIICGSLDDWSNNLNIILQWSPFSSKEELMQQFDDIGPHGTKIIVYNLWFNEDGLLELDFDNDEEDIRLRDVVNHEKVSKKDRSIESHISYRIRFSLRAYASVLYLRQFTNFQIILRGKPVQQYHIADELKFSEVVTYKPQLGKFSKEVYAKTTIGYVKEAPHLPVSGINVYHKNRLIRPFWKLTNSGNSVGNGVVGVLEANFIEPAHDKQDFERSTLFIRLETRLKQMIYDYWKTHCHLIGIASPVPDIRTMQKQRLTDQPATEFAATNIQREPRIDQPVIGLSANMQKEMHLDQHAVGLSANMEKGMHLDQPVIGPSADVLKGMHLNQPVIGLSANSTSNIQNDVLHPIIGLAADGRMQVNAKNTWNSVSGNEGHGSSKGGLSTDCSISASVDQICEENVQLFMRCEEHRQKQIDMKKKIEEMEREFEDKKRKCSELASRIESERRQIRQQSEKA